jgi:uncharacterized DUF497 family protein
MALSRALLDQVWAVGHTGECLGDRYRRRFRVGRREARSNLEKHGVSFPEAAGSGTDRVVVIGTSLRDRVLYVVHVERRRRDRIITARPASRAERDVYESGETP